MNIKLQIQLVELYMSLLGAPHDVKRSNSQKLYAELRDAIAANAGVSSQFVQETCENMCLIFKVSKCQKELNALSVGIRQLFAAILKVCLMVVSIATLQSVLRVKLRDKTNCVIMRINLKVLQVISLIK